MLTRLRPLLLDGMLLFCLALAGYFFVVHAKESLPQVWDWERIIPYIYWNDAAGWHAGLFLRGLATTVRLGVCSGLLALVVGFAVGSWTAQHKNWLTCVFMALITVLRNTPPLVLLFLLYFFASEQLFSGLDDRVRNLPPLLQEVMAILFAPAGQADRMLAAVITLGLYEGAYVAEIVRAGLESLPRSQWDAAAALGFSRGQRLRLVMGPQALPLMMPPLAGQCVSVFKESALASLISVPELTFQGMEVMSVSRLPFETWFVVGGLYLILSVLCVEGFRQWEKRRVWRN